MTAGLPLLESSSPVCLTTNLGTALEFRPERIEHPGFARTMCEPPQKGERSFAGGRSPFADTGLCNLGSRLQHSRVAPPGILDIEARYRTSF
jgi:hypothetical protein